MKAKCLWFTGLPCSGKTTLAKKLLKYYPNAQLLDGDEIRNTPLAKDVGFAPEDRAKHILRMGQIAKMLVDNGVTAICSFVSPQRHIRDEIRAMFNAGDFVEIHISTPLEECMKRDVKGMYAKAQQGIIKNFTGLSAPYDEPTNAELTMDTTDMTEEESIEKLLEVIKPFENKAAFFVGRWNGVLHRGHTNLFDRFIEKGQNVVLLVRNVKPDEKNPWTAKEVKEMLEFAYKDEPLVKVMIVQDVEGLYWGRGVGYNVKELEVTDKIASISGTRCRELIAAKDDAWMDLVDPRVVDFLKKKYSNA